jgi:CubicO group peptidase (beta-lactamase class C family)
LTSRPSTALAALTDRLVAQDILPGVSCAVLRGTEVIDHHCSGWADREQQRPMRVDTIVRAYSSTKLITSCAALLLHDRGHFALDDPIQRWIPAFAHPQVLRPGARTLDDVEPARGDITIRHLLSHQAGLTHGVFAPGALLHEAYVARGVRRPDTTLAELMDTLAGLPLLFHPGQGWEYSAATDVLARLCEVVSGQRFGDFLQQHLLGPLGMVDTGFVLRPEQRPRFAALYGAAHPADPLGPGLQRLDDVPYPGAWQEPRPRQSGAGGLFTTLPDTLALLRALLASLQAGGDGLLKPATAAEMMRNQLPAAQCVQFPAEGPAAHIARQPQLGFGLAGAVTLAPSAWGGPDAVGELQWGGLAGTHWWIAPRAGLAGAFMTQRLMAFWHPAWFEFKRLAHELYAANG